MLDMTTADPAQALQPDMSGELGAEVDTRRRTGARSRGGRSRAEPARPRQRRTLRCRTGSAQPGFLSSRSRPAGPSNCSPTE